MMLDAANGTVSVRSLDGGWSELAAPTLAMHPCGMYFFSWSMAFTQPALARDTISLFFQCYNETPTGTYTADGQSGFQFANIQLEQGAFPTSYIPTTNATATRAADVAVISGTAFSDVYRSSAMSALIRASRIGITTEQARALSFSDGTTSNTIEIAVTGAIKPIGYITTAGVSQSAAVGLIDGSLHVPRAFALGVAANDVALVSDGVIDVVDTSASLPTTIAQANIGNNPVLNRNMCGHVARIAYWPARLPNATLQQLTAG